MGRSCKLSVIFGVLFLWYALFGFLIAPILFRHFGERYLQATFSPESSLERVWINPFTAAIRVEGFSVRDADEAWSLEWREAEIDFSLATLLRLYPVIDAVRLDGANMIYERRSGEGRSRREMVSGSDDRVRDWRAWVEVLNRVEIPRIRIALLEVSNGRVQFEDRSATGGFFQEIDSINFTLRNLTTVIGAGDETSMRLSAETEAGTRLSWEGDLQSQPLRSAGRFALSGLRLHDLSPYFDERIRFSLERAVYELSFDYTMDFSDPENLFSVVGGNMALRDLLCRPVSEEARLIAIESIQFSEIGFLFPAMELEVSEVAVNNGETRIIRDADGRLNLLDLIVLPEGSGASEPVEAWSARSGALDSLPALSYNVGSIRISDYRIHWMDALSEGAVEISVEAKQTEIIGFSSDFNAPVEVETSYLIGDSGTAQIAGSVIPDGREVALTVQVQSLPLPLLSPYAQEFAGARLSGGTFDFDGRLQVSGDGRARLSGDSSLQGLAFTLGDSLQGGWTRLDVKDLAVELPHERGALPPVYAAGLRMSGGQAEFADYRFEPAARVYVADLNLNMRDLDLREERSASIRLEGGLNGSELALNGAVTLSQIKEATHITVSLLDLSLPGFSPYSGRALGRRIASGWLNLESDWRIESSRLHASNRLRVVDFNLGDRVESENATRLPLDLAVTLLKGPNGEIDLSLPLSGDLSDPRVGLGQIIRTAVFGLITNVVSSPFRLLAGLAGKDEDLSFVAFEPGSAELSSEMVSRLNTLSAALKERPGIQLGMTPKLSTADSRVILEAALRQSLMEGAELSDDRLYERRLTQRYRAVMRAAGTPDRETQADSPEGLAKMITELLPAVELSERTLVELGEARGAAVKAHLVVAQGIDVDRFSMEIPEMVAEASAVAFDLR